MYFAQHYLDCLSQASYLVGDERSGRAVVVDPRRDIEEYVADAAAHGLRIEGVILTHFHADFLAGHLELQEATGAWIGYGTAAQADYPVRHLADGERIALGEEADSVVLEIMHTPGHTPESISILVFEKATDEVAYGVLTGDALFIGDVGRPDLLASIGVTADELGAMLHDSVQHKLMGLSDEVRVFPAHGAGSACGKNLSTERQSTIGEQRLFNYACRPMSEAEFVEIVTEGQPAAPDYFVYDAVLNRQQRATYSGPEVPVLPIDEALARVADGAMLLDAREGVDFSAGHVAGSLSIPLDGRFAETAGMVLDPDDRIVVIAPDDHEDEVVTRLARIGFDHVIGRVADIETVLIGLPPERVGKASRITPAAFDAARAELGDDLHVIDVRNPGETASGMVPGAVNIPLAQLRRRIDEVPREGTVVLNCAGGWRSAVAAAYLRSQGHADVSDVLGGFNAWEAAQAPATAASQS